VIVILLFKKDKNIYPEMLLGRELRWLSLREPLERNLAVFVISAALYASSYYFLFS
jgi:hypothetical protein|tara:strand:+ start:1091 stop:1258 length:168 start_codon:yes stop_codon:yes gene_type:complete